MRICDVQGCSTKAAWPNERAQAIIVLATGTKQDMCQKHIDELLDAYDQICAEFRQDTIDLVVDLFAGEGEPPKAKGPTVTTKVEDLHEGDLICDSETGEAWSVRSNSEAVPGTYELITERGEEHRRDLLDGEQEVTRLRD